MKILLIHNRYYFKSGPENYLFNIEKELKKEGHDVVNFSLDYKQNNRTPYAKYFPAPIGNASEYSYSDQILTLTQKLEIVGNLFYNDKAAKKLKKLLVSEQIDCAIVLQFWGKLSPSLFDVLIKNKIPTFLRISDFGLICGTNTLLKNNEHCTECIESRFSCIKNKCVDQSYLKSALNSFAQINFFQKYAKKINFIFTCHNTMSIYKQAGFSENLNHIPTFYAEDFQQKQKVDSNKVIYLGRVAEDKGLHNIIPLFPDSNKIHFEIWGSGDECYIARLAKISSQRQHKNIHLMGHLERSKIKDIFNGSFISIIPSLWHDNLPNSLIESMSNGVPVISPNYGCFPEFIVNGENGYLYNNDEDLKTIFKRIMNLEENAKSQLSYNSTMFAKKTFSSKLHLDKLIRLIKKANEKNH